MEERGRYVVKNNHLTRLKRRLSSLVALILAAFHAVPSLTVILNPLLYVMFFPIGIYAFLTWPWPLLKDTPDPFNPSQSLYWLTYMYYTHLEGSLLPSLFRWGVIDLALVVGGTAVFLLAFITWLRSHRGLITNGIYRHVRHPQYLGFILAALGLSIRTLRPVSLLAWLTLVSGYVALASYEERGLIKRHGEVYLNYMGKAPFLLPFFKVRLPSTLSPDRAHRYVLLTVVYVAASLIVTAVSRNYVVALRGSF